jgi:C-terminal processing protease CtpA/Prc
MRAEIEIPVLEAHMLENNNIAYINLYQFSINAGAEMQQALEELLAQEPIGVNPRPARKQWRLSGCRF